MIATLFDQERMVRFTGHEFLATAAIAPRHQRQSIPASWIMVSFAVPDLATSNQVAKFLEKEMCGRFAIVFASGHLMIFFESDTDAVLFKLMDGASRCLQTS